MPLSSCVICLWVNGGYRPHTLFPFSLAYTVILFTCPLTGPKRVRASAVHRHRSYSFVRSSDYGSSTYLGYNFIVHTCSFVFSLAGKNFYVNGFLVKMVFRRKIFSGVRIRCSLFLLTPPGGHFRKMIVWSCRRSVPGEDHGKRKKYICGCPGFAARLKSFYQKSRN